jgi:hypothetical protein
MSGKIINLRQARKTRARDEKAAQAAENRLHFGRSKAQKRLESDARDRRDKTLDGRHLGDGSASDTGADHPPKA